MLTEAFRRQWFRKGRGILPRKKKKTYLKTPTIRQMVQGSLIIHKVDTCSEDSDSTPGNSALT